MEVLPRLLLPYDVLADVLARLAPRGLAVSRCVCKEWRAIVDDRCQLQLRSDLLPLRVGGIFLGSHATEAPDFFARPSSSMARGPGSSRVVAGRLESFVRMDDGVPLGADYEDDIEIADCCNGLLLLAQRELVVVNPATRRWACFPLPHCGRNDSFLLPPDDEGHDEAGRLGFLYWSYLAFDPTVSPHYEVISMQHPLNGEGVATRLRGLQWPPPVYVMRAYSSMTGRWEERRFALDDDDDEGVQRRTIDGVSARAYGHAAYWRGALYVHCNSHFILRINLSDNRYRVINLPADANACDDYCEVYLGKSKNGIYFAAVVNDIGRVLIWFLDESDGKAQWVLKHGINQHDLITHMWDNASARTDRPWILQKDGYSHEECKLGPTVENNSDWDSDDENSAVEIKEDCDTTENAYGPIIFGFHPYKEIVFLHSSRVVAYHFSRSKVQDLGDLGYIPPDQLIRRAFVYAPCWVGELSESDHS